MLLSLHQFVIFLIASLCLATTVSSAKELASSRPVDVDFLTTLSTATSVVSQVSRDLSRHVSDSFV
jgi:hypothetical protein